MTTSTVLGALVALLSVALCSRYRSRSPVPLPPGPKGHWLFGSALDMRKADAFWLKFAEWNDQYGPLVSFRVLYRTSFVTTDPQLISELFEKRAANYSNRRVNQMAKLIGWEEDIVFLPYGPLLKRYRTMLHKALNNRVSLDYIPIQLHEVRRFMQRLVETPEGFMDNIHLMAASIAIRIAYGYKVNSAEDRFVKVAEEMTSGFSDVITPGRWLVDQIPPLKYLPEWFPLAAFQRRAQYLKRLDMKHRDNPFNYVQEQIAAGTAEDSYTLKLLNSNDGKPLDKLTILDIKNTASSIYSGASDTTVSAVQSFFLAMTLYPAIQAKAQAEIDAYLKQRPIGIEDSPTARMLVPTDRPNLPYTNALIHELLRWHPVLNAVAHQSGDKDDENVISGGKTYRIPAGSMIVANVWKILHDPEVYEQPEIFMPERYLVADPPPEPENYAFGFGRRLCPGIHIAQQSMWISVSNILANFTITKAKDESGEDITPEERYTKDLISHPVPFQCSIVPRKSCDEWLRKVAE